MNITFGATVKVACFMATVGLHQAGRAQLAGQCGVASQADLHVPFGTLAQPAIAGGDELIVGVEGFVVAVARGNRTEARSVSSDRSVSALQARASTRRSRPRDVLPSSGCKRGLSAYDVPTNADGTTLPLGGRCLLSEQRRARRAQRQTRQLRPRSQHVCYGTTTVSPLFSRMF